MSITWPAKDPDEVLDYALDWSPRGLDDDTIATFNALVETGAVVVDTTDHDGLLSTVWLSGGAAGTKCTIRLRITTTLGRTLDETANITIKSR